MKLALFGALSAIAIACASHAAAATDSTVLSGYVDADYAYMNAHVSGLGSADVNTWGGKGAVAFPISGNWGAQLDATINDFDAGQGLGSETVGTPSGHVFYRTDKWLAGAFGGAEIASHVDLAGGGLEGQLYPNKNYLVDAGVAYGQITQGSGIDLWGARLNGKGFITPNLSIDAGVNYVNLHASGASADLWTEHLGGEYKLDTVPVSFTLAYERGDVTRLKVSSDAVLVGVRWTFGGGTLHDRDTHGASLPNFTQTFGGEAGQSLVAVTSGALGYIYP
jgi:hypothetical protein